MKSRVYAVLWVTALAVSISGVVAIGVGNATSGWWLFVVGGSVLAGFALRSAWQTTRARVAWPLGGTYVLVTGALLSYVALLAAIGVPWGDIPLWGRVAVLVTGLQALLLAVGVRVTGIPFVERVIVPAAGHLLLFTGSVLVVGVLFFAQQWTVTYAAALLYATGLSALALHSFWLGQHADEVVPPRPFTVDRYWEQVMIVALIVGLVGVAIASITLRGSVSVDLAPGVSLARASAIVAGCAAVVAISTLVPPAVPISPLRILTGPISAITQHALITLIMLNALAVACLFLVPAAFVWILGGYVFFLGVGVLVEYGAVAHAVLAGPPRRTAASSAPLSDTAAVTVVVNAFNEAEILSASLDHNLDALDGLPLLLIPAAKSTDRTMEIAEEYRDRYPDRVRLIPGTSGSKAGDLNLAWEHIDTEYVLLLDADETVQPEFLTRGLDILEDSPSVGIVQGRKVERYPFDSWLARFVSVDRRYSTWIDHPFMHTAFGASHFAGSAALLRHKVPEAVGGWSEDTLTEDIDLTLRLYLRSDWRIRYEPGLVARVLNPKSVLALVRQRRRWARGWVSALASHGLGLVRGGGRLGWRRRLGLLWILFTAVNAPLYTIFPALVVVWLLGLAPVVSSSLVATLALVLIPARAISFGYASLRDPEIPVRARPGSILGVIAAAYLWIPMTWFIQLHALYLHLSGAPKLWEGTEKAPGPETGPRSGTEAISAASGKNNDPVDG